MVSSMSGQALLVFLITMMMIATTTITKAFEFNYEIERRVYERISSFMDIPTNVVEQLAMVKKNDYYDQMDYLDRDSFASIMFTLWKLYDVENIFYGTEVGMWRA